MKPILIFDYDGTLHETMKIYAPAVYDTVRWLNTSCGVSAAVPEEARIKSWLGMNTADMWNDFMPELAPEQRARAAHRIGDSMRENLLAGRGGWYDGVGEMLDRLKAAGFRMAVLSNCGISYARTHWDFFGMDRWFTAFFPCECWDGAPKQEIMADIARGFSEALERTPVRRKTDRREQADEGDGSCGFVVIGDRYSDFEGARAAKAPFIGCRYGYGTPEELAEADAQADRPSDIARMLIGTYA